MFSLSNFMALRERAQGQEVSALVVVPSVGTGCGPHCASQRTANTSRRRRCTSHRYIFTQKRFKLNQSTLQI